MIRDSSRGFSKSLCPIAGSGSVRKAELCLYYGRDRTVISFTSIKKANSSMLCASINIPQKFDNVHARQSSTPNHFKITARDPGQPTGETLEEILSSQSQLHELRQLMTMQKDIQRSTKGMTMVATRSMSCLVSSVQGSLLTFICRLLMLAVIRTMTKIGLREPVRLSQERKPQISRISSTDYHERREMVCTSERKEQCTIAR